MEDVQAEKRPFVVTIMTAYMNGLEAGEAYAMQRMGGGELKLKKNEFMTVVEEIAFKYAKLVNERIDKVENGLTGEDLREVYDGIQMLGHITATMERLSRMDIPETA